MVALLAEGVDRNDEDTGQFESIEPSPSSRRAWIEISQQQNHETDACVALLAEGVDRNGPSTFSPVSLSTVALLAEGVDRNSLNPSSLSSSRRRPPRGGRG